LSSSFRRSFFATPTVQAVNNEVVKDKIKRLNDKFIPGLTGYFAGIVNGLD
jgi:hypothetical protein